MRWCESCQAIVPTAWGECEKCHAVLIKAPAPYDFGRVDVKLDLPAGHMSHDALITILNSIQLRSRKQKVNVRSAASPEGKYEEVPHTTQCPLCQMAEAYGIYRTVNTNGSSRLELACAQCATSRIPFRQFMGVRIVKCCILFATIQFHAHDAWTIDTITPA